MTVTEKILARAAGRPAVQAGEIVEAAVDLAMFHDGLGPLFYPLFRELNLSVWDPQKAAVFIDHAAPPSSLVQARWVAETRQFATQFNLRHVYDMRGVSHQVLPEEGLIKPGQVIVGTDSHTCTGGALGAFATGIGSTEMAWVLATGRLWFRVPATLKVEIVGQPGAYVVAKDIILKVLALTGPGGAAYQAVEFGGEAVRRLSVDGRLTLCNMVVEMGAKNGIIEPDQATYDYLADKGGPGDRAPLASDPDAAYQGVLRIDAPQLEPQVACPPDPANVVDITAVAGVKVDQVLIGTCTGGRMEDFRLAAGIVRGRPIAPGVRCLILPASLRIYRQLVEENLLPVFLDAGCVVLNPGCGPCGGSHQGLLAAGEVCVGTHNRNFPGRMGSPEGRVYLASPATAAAAAVCGELVDPRRFL